MKVGFGYDVHQLVEGRKLILGGVEIPYKKGLLGHSDGDVLLHAICDALLGAIGAGDLGKHFPENDLKSKGISSLELLRVVKILKEERGFRTNNIDCTVVAQNPKLAEYIPKMEKSIAGVLGIDAKKVNVKATTTEGLGFTGKGEGIAAYAVVSVRSIEF
ncbi:MAG: 2-C-methyl-D-erythritol 2,4-cyclodiphosphate synthase [Deltaproteobacteria bacterium]|jgi:2-C-methyl-D-erythritol 2,4-cyclodiphosphate synthase|nr:MAG: 2-C-methyl-D-erythritol 2,4-cyclodiphosphate synthase [Deltaproteobacteria bacterium]